MELRYPLQGASDDGVSEAVYLADPDGNGIEIYADRAAQRVATSCGEVQMGTDQLDIDGLMAELRVDGGPWQGLPTGTTIGHVHLQVRDLAEAERFTVRSSALSSCSAMNPAPSSSRPADTTTTSG